MWIHGKNYFIINKISMQQYLNNEPFDISFGEYNPLYKGEIMQSDTVPTKLLVVKVYDHVWWRKFLIKCRILKPIYLTKVKSINND